MSRLPLERPSSEVRLLVLGGASVALHANHVVDGRVGRLGLVGLLCLCLLFLFRLDIRLLKY